jgi:exodeoxyribonuclease V alpha subunit
MANNSSTSVSSYSSTITPNRLAAILAKARAEKAALQKHNTTAAENLKPENPEISIVQGIGRTGEVITYNEKQIEFINLASSGVSSILIGAAGTGKTTCMRGTVQKLIQSGRAGILEAADHKYLPKSGLPGIVVCAFTRRATANIRRNLDPDIQNNCITIHKLLEYEPVYFDVTDPVTGDTKKTMRFEATRNFLRPLPASIHTIIIEESSMVSVELFKEIESACPHKPQFIFLGDIQQLPPVFGSAILGYKMLELKTIELTEVYRQALESPIIRLAHRILSGNIIPHSEYKEWNTPNQLTIHPWKKKLSADVGLLTAAKFFTTALSHGAYDTEKDIILIPFNKSFGTDELNKHIANYIARQESRIVWEIIAGFQKLYFSVGDKVLYDKEDAVIVSITPNASYAGRAAQQESPDLDYWGHRTISAPETHHISNSEAEISNIDFILDQAASIEDEERVRAASHIIRLRKVDTEQEFDISSAADINTLLLGYALTVHKSQGSEWRKVFLVLHQSHATMIQRELLYTAVTRAKEELYVICEPESFTNGIKSQRIKGNTLAEKAEYFKGKLEDNSFKGGV